MTIEKGNKAESARKNSRQGSGEPGGIESFTAPFETVVHCFGDGEAEFAYFSRTADLFEVSPEASVALRHVEATGNELEAINCVESVFGAEPAERVKADFLAMRDLGLFDREGLPTGETHRKIVDAYIDHRPRSLMFFLTERCNLKCIYCYESLSGVHDNGAVLRSGDGKAMLLDFFDRSKGRKNLKLTFFGGEPLSNWAVFKEMVLFAEKEAERRGQFIGFTTTSNLTLLDEDKADFLVKHRFTVMVSIDGDEKTHDANRLDKGGRGTYRKVSENLKMLIAKSKAAGIRLPRLRATWVPGVSDREGIRNHLLEFGTGEDLVNVGVAGYDIAHSHLDTASDESQEEVNSQLRKELQSVLSGGETKTWIVDSMRAIDKELALEEPHAEALQELCGVCRNMLAATPTGDLYPCHRYVGMEEFKVGNIHEGGIDEQKVRGYYDKVNKSFSEGCGKCWVRHLCKGSCPWISSGKDGDIKTPRIGTCSGIRDSYEQMLGSYAQVRRDPELLARILTPGEPINSDAPPEDRGGSGKTVMGHGGRRPTWPITV